MELYIFNQSDRKLSGIVEAFEYLRWTRHYSHCGSFELKAIATANNIALLQIGNIIWKNDDSETGLIDFIEMTSQEQEYITVSGRFATSFLSRRIVMGSSILNSDLGAVVGALISDNLLNPSIADRKINGITYTPQVLDVPVSTQISWRNLMDAVTNLCEAADIGIRTVFNPSIGTFDIQLYKGTQTSAVFSKEYENITEQVFTRSISEFANFAVVGGEGEGAERTIINVGNSSGEERYEIFVDAKDLRSEDFLDDYTAALIFRGSQKLVEQAIIEAFDVTINQYGNLVYKVDYDVGSRIQAVSKRWGVSLSARITEVEENYDRDGMSLNVILGKSLLTLSEKLKRSVE